MARLDDIQAALLAQEQHQEALLQLSNVIGVGTGFRMRNGKLTREVCVQVLVDRKLPSASLAAAEIAPSRLRVQEQEVGTDVLEITVEAQQDTTRYRPVPGGCSIGPEASVSAGTLGGWACDNTDDTIVLLTNNHVISNLDTMPVLRRIVQPGRLDGGVLPADVIGSLKRDVTVSTVANTPGAAPPASVVDAAIGTIEVDRTDQIQQLGVPAIYELQAPALNMNVQKRGRTTRLTTNGRITTINTTLNITYRNRTRLGRIQNAFIITSTNGNLFSNAGDSGSLILNQARGAVDGTFPVVGLLFAGGTNAAGTPITIANDINAVFGALNLATVCACVARAVIRAIIGSEMAGSSVTSAAIFRGERYLVMHKERQFRRLYDQLQKSGRFGEGLDKLIRTEAARVGEVITQDEEAFGLLVRALRPFVKQPTNYDILETRLDRETVENLLKFATRVAQRSPKLRARLAFAKVVARALEGAKLGQVLRSAKLSV